MRGKSLERLQAIRYNCYKEHGKQEMKNCR